MSNNTVPLEAARRIGERLLEVMKVPRQVTRDVLEVLVDAEARGLGSHGLIRLQRIVAGIRSGARQPRAEPLWYKPGAVLVTVDGLPASGAARGPGTHPRVLLPGERGHARAAAARERGLQLSDNLIQQLNTLGEGCGIDERF